MSGTAKPRRRHAATTVLASRQAIVIGPTPPGTGVIALATSTASAKAISIDHDEGALFRALGSGHAVLAASGTVTLQTALYGTPGVACYIAPALSAAIGRRLVSMDRVILPNALLGREVYPFLFQERASAPALAGAMRQVLSMARRSMQTAAAAAAPTAHEE